MANEQRTLLPVLLTLVIAAFLAASAPASALVIDVLQNPANTVLDVSVVAVPFVQDGFPIAGKIVLTEVWTDPFFTQRPVIFRIATEPGDGTRWEVNKVAVNQTGSFWSGFTHELLNCSSGVCIQSDESDEADFAQGTGLPRTSVSFPDIFLDELANREFLQFTTFPNATNLPSPGEDFQRFFIDLGEPIVGLSQEPRFGVPEPSALLLLAASLVGMSALVIVHRRS